MPRGTPIQVPESDRQILEKWVRSGKTEKRIVDRASMILMLDKGKSGREVAEAVSVMPCVVSKWRKRYAEKGLAGLTDMPRPGKPSSYGKTTEQRILELLDEPPPEGYGQWNGNLLAKRLGDVSTDQVWRVLRKHRIQLQRRRSWCISTDPQFSQKAADVVGLYLAPPENAIVLCVDEKPCIQALERAQGYLRMPDGRTMSGFNHEYKRHGTTTLFAALDVASGMVRTGHYQRRRRREFLDFMNDVVQQYPSGQEIHVVLDNLNTHKPKRDQWLARHPNVSLHYTPTHASWMNMVEIWFSILTRNSLRGASFTSPRQVRRHIDAFTKAYNEDASAFEWTKREVTNKTLAKRYSDLCK